MIIDATNGHIMLTWDHLDGGGDLYDEGWPTYYLDLKVLGRRRSNMKQALGTSIARRIPA